MNKHENKVVKKRNKRVGSEALPTAGVATAKAKASAERGLGPVSSKIARSASLTNPPCAATSLKVSIVKGDDDEFYYLFETPNRRLIVSG